ncbi:hypothetical protein [Candidatus Uabimicrobium sp. HlEnr_7]|uniref:hypothetical protein n=1 Tax=Candidatus Uabimicrobium helgolandensis TaxID=3095367 RepID=UPI00355880E5
MSKEMTFDKWRDYCFDRPITKPEWYWDEDLDDYEPESIELAKYLQQLFSQSNKLISLYSDEQINQGLIFICSIGSNYFHSARESQVPKNLQLKWVTSIKSLYSEVFQVKCSNHYGHLSNNLKDSNPINNVCYMFWDIDGLESAAMFPEHEYLVDPIFETLTFAISLPNIACIESALHGLGHLKPYHPKRVESIINNYLESPRLITKELELYAQRAFAAMIL